MKAISILQPWASLVVCGAKCIETRSWSTVYRGLLLIHASKAPNGFGKHLWENAVITRQIHEDHDWRKYEKLPFGAIIGAVDLRDVVAVEKLNCLSVQEEAFGDFSSGRYGWLLSDAVRFPHPIPCRGALSIWAVPADVAAQVNEAMSELHPGTCNLPA